VVGVLRFEVACGENDGGAWFFFFFFVFTGVILGLPVGLDILYLQRG
jgi:hypothetical protein